MLVNEYDKQIKHKKSYEQKAKSIERVPDMYDHLSAIGTHHGRQLERQLEAERIQKKAQDGYSKSVRR